jgi:hypothetical protein
MWSPLRWPWLPRVWVVCVRCCAVLCPIVFLYLAVGYLMFPEWFYSLLWERRYLDSDWWQLGLDYWLSDQPFWFFVGTTAAVILLVLGYRRRARVFSFIDRFAFHMIAWSLAGAVFTALTVRIYSASCLPVEQLNALAYELALKEVKSLPLHPMIQVPVDFHYLDSERVKGLYNEIEQDLVEQQRTVASTGTVTGKIGGKAGPIEGEIGGSKQQNSSSTYQRLEFSPEKKCIEVMNYSLKGNVFKYLTTADDWLRRRQAADFQARYNEIQRRALSVQVTSPTPAADTEKSSTKDEQEAAARQLEGYRQELKSELASLDGLLFIEGEFAISRTSQGTITLVEKFSEIPRVVLRVTASAAPGLNGIAPSGRAHLKVFGTVVRPLVGDAPIEVRPIAVF